MAKQDLALRLTGVTKTFGGVRALDKVDFEVRRGEVHCLAGENGCGKSTLIKIVTGVYTPDPGAGLEVFGQRIEQTNPTKSRAQGIAVIWQDLALFPHMTVAENIGFDEMVGGAPRLVKRKEIRKRAAAVLDRLGVSVALDTLVGELPIAQRQIVAIARALMGEARLVFMDEPTASLTQTETDGLLEVVRTLSAQGVAIVFVSHRLAEVIDIAARVTVIRDGKLVGVFPTEGMTQARLGELMTGSKLEAEVRARKLTDASTVLALSGLTRSDEFHDVSFSIKAGEIVGLIGLIGAGRTELAHAIIGMARPESGEVLLDGQQITPKNIREAIASGIAYVSEDRLSLGLIQPQSIADNTVMSVIHRLQNPSGLLSAARRQNLVEKWINDLAIKVGMPADAVSTLSGGNQQRVVLAKWLATEPKLLILDSPTVGVDVGARAGIFRIVRRLAEQGLAILLISDEVTEVLFNADRVLHMASGRILEELDPREVSANQLEAKIYA